MINSKVVYLKCENGDSVNNVFSTPVDFNGYMVGVVDISGQLTRKEIKKGKGMSRINVDRMFESNEHDRMHNREDEDLLDRMMDDGAGKKPSKYYNDPLFLCCDIVSDSAMGHIISDGVTLPVLRKLTKQSSTNVKIDIPTILFVKVESSPVSTIRLYIVNSDGKSVPLSTCRLNVTLLFWKPAY